MSRNGSGVYSLPAGNPVITNTTISSTWANNTLSDIATALTQSISKDGQTVPTANLPMGGFKHTGLSAGTGAGDSLRYEQLFSQGNPVDVASAATVDIGAQLTNFINITGTTTITSFGTKYNGPKMIKFTNSLTLTYNATTLVTPGNVNIVTQAGDTCILIPKSTTSGTSDGWLVLAYNVTPTGLQGQRFTAFSTAGTSSAYTLTPIPAISSNSTNLRFRVKLNAAPTGSPTLAVSGQSAANFKYYDASGNKQFITSAIAPINWVSDVEFDGTDWVMLNTLPGAVTDKIQPITASVGSNALTITLNPTVLDFRAATLGSGTVNTRTISSAINLVVSSGSTLGSSNGILSRLIVLAIDNAGTVELAVVNSASGINIDETTLISTTAEGGAGAADSANIIYSTTARTNVPFRVVGFVESTQATAGTWATVPSKIQGYGGNSLQHINAICNSSAVTSTSGVAIDFTGIPSWVKRINVIFNAVSTNGASLVQCQIGSSSGISTSGYSSSSASSNVAYSSTSGFVIYGASAADIRTGIMVLTNISGNTWVCGGNNITGTGAGGNFPFGGVVNISDKLDRIRITTVNGTDTFDSGSVNILWE